MVGYWNPVHNLRRHGRPIARIQLPLLFTVTATWSRRCPPPGHHEWSPNRPESWSQAWNQILAWVSLYWTLFSEVVSTHWLVASFFYRPKFTKILVAQQPKLPRRAAARAGEGKLKNCTHSLVFLHFFFLLNVFALLSRHSIAFLIVRYCSLCPKKNVNLIS